jgi:hypothetical protein
VAEFSSHTPGTFSWVELATTDQKAAVAFHRALFGWEVNEQPIGPGEMYSMFLMRGTQVDSRSSSIHRVRCSPCSSSRALKSLRTNHVQRRGRRGPQRRNA